jgi:hypothetical protein
LALRALLVSWHFRHIVKLGKIRGEFGTVTYYGAMSRRGGESYIVLSYIVARSTEGQRGSIGKR